MSLRTAVGGVLFDLDGTLADTAADLAYALNLQRSARGLSEVPLDRLRPFASSGARGLLRAGFGLTPEHDAYPEMREEFLELYARNLVRETRLFDGMHQVLDRLESLGLPWGIVTNKLARFTQPLVQALGLGERARCVISGDTCSRAKPHPDPLLEAARRLELGAAHCIYVGDDERDVQAARAASMMAVIALYGYLGEDAAPEEWEADAAVEEPLALLKLLPAPLAMG